MANVAVAEVFAPLLADARYKAAWGGRGSGKSHFFASLMVGAAVRHHRRTGQGLRAVGVREVQKTLDQSVKRLIEDKLDSLAVGAEWHVTNAEIRTPGGGVILFQGMQDHNAQSIKSLEGMNIAWVEEAQTLTERSFELLRPTIRADESEIWCSWNPRHPTDAVDRFFRGPQGPPDGAIVVRANGDDNPWFPRELEVERELDRQVNPDRWGHIWLGDYEPMAVGAIWDRAILHETRVIEPPELSRIVVAIDPAVSSEVYSDEHGIVVAGLSSHGHGYVLEDGTTRGGPEVWARRATTLADKWEADAIVCERNQGGDMVRQTLRSFGPRQRIVEVTATRGKHVRAEPIAAMYHTGRVHHVGAFPELEAQLCQITASGYEGNGSPDRADALVWALAELMPRIAVKRACQHQEVRDDYGWDTWTP